MEPTDPNIAAPPASNAGRQVSSGVTIGSKLASLLDWANKLGLQPTLALVIDATRTLEYPQQIGTALGYLRMPESQRYLRTWQDEVPLLPDLLELLEASSIAPYIYVQNPAAPGNVPSSVNWSGVRSAIYHC